MRLLNRSLLTLGLVLGLVLGAGSVGPHAATAATPHGSAAAAADPVVTTQITDKPKNPYLGSENTFSYTADFPGAKFRCKITGPGRKGVLRECPVDTVPSGGASSGSITWKLSANPKAYTFRVRAYLPTGSDIGGGTPLTHDVNGSNADYTWRVYSVYAISSFQPHTGPSFNNPISTRNAGRRSLTRIIRTVNSMPGYKQGTQGGPCPGLYAKYGLPGFIRITLYSAFDGAFAKAMVLASKRCLSVQILMNDHLTTSNDPAWRTMVKGLGSRRRDSSGHFRRSFAHRCSHGCSGSGVLHTKMYLFHSQIPAPRESHNKIKHFVFVGSSNMTSNASIIQWNDLYGVSDRPRLYDQFITHFNQMRKDNGFHRTAHTVNDGKYHTTWFPAGKGKDPELGALKNVKCSGATGGTGINGHTLVYINMHAWFGLRGLAFQREVRDMYSRGCYIKILYSFMTKRVYYRLTHGTGSRMVARRTIFSLDGNRFADVYSHYKNFLVSGHWGSKTNARYVWTGSNNFTPDGRYFDEVMFRIDSPTAYSQYRKQWLFIKNRKSSARYASFLEPVGGGRAPFGARTLTAAGPGFLSDDDRGVLVPQSGSSRAGAGGAGSGRTAGR